MRDPASGRFLLAIALIVAFTLFVYLLIYVASLWLLGSK